MQSEKCIAELFPVAISRISHAVVDMGAEAAAGLRVCDSESRTAGAGDNFVYSASEGAPGLYREQKTIPGATLQAKSRILRIADE